MEPNESQPPLPPPFVQPLWPLRISLDEFVALTDEQQIVYQRSLPDDPEVKKAYVRSLVYSGKFEDAPVRNSRVLERLHNQAYFRQEYANEIKPALDRMITTGKSIMFDFHNFRKWKPSTLRTRIDLAFKYIIHYLDPEGKYRKLRQRCEIRVLKTGVQIFHDSDAVLPFIFREMDDTLSYKELMDMITQFLENERLMKFELPDAETLPFVLTEDEERELKVFLDSVPGIVHIMTRNSIKILRRNDS